MKLDLSDLNPSHYVSQKTFKNLGDPYKNFYTKIIDGFEVRLRFVDEILNPEDMYDLDCEGHADVQAIYNGDATWLCAIVEVFKCGVELAYTTLGAITYQWDKLEDFINDSFYDMAQEAINGAKLKLEELRAIA